MSTVGSKPKVKHANPKCMGIMQDNLCHPYILSTVHVSLSVSIEIALLTYQSDPYDQKSMYPRNGIKTHIGNSLKKTTQFSKFSLLLSLLLLFSLQKPGKIWRWKDLNPWQVVQEHFVNNVVYMKKHVYSILAKRKNLPHPSTQTQTIHTQAYKTQQK